MNKELKKCADRISRQIDQTLYCSLKDLSLHLELLKMYKEDYQAACLAMDEMPEESRQEAPTEYVSIIPQS